MSACQATSCTGSGFARLDLVYDGEGHRTRLVQRTSGGTVTTTDFTYGGDSVVREVSTTGATTITRTFVTDEAGAIVKVTIGGDPISLHNGTYLVTWNGHGDALALSKIHTDDTLVPANRYTYTTWGTPTTTTHNGYADLGFRYLYVGQYGVTWDHTASVPTGLHYMRARHYSPEFGRFLQADPARLEANAYAYAESSPVSKVDPSGQAAFCAIPFIAPLCVVAVRTIATAVVSAAITILRNPSTTVTITRTISANMRFVGTAATRLGKELAAKLKYPLKAFRSECHHIWPKYIGGPNNYPRVRINAAYHQVITNRFRDYWGYGRGYPSRREALRIMLQVYSELPIAGLPTCP